VTYGSATLAGDTREEVDLQPAASTGGENYGWRLYEGFCTNCCNVTVSNVSSILPVFDYEHVNGRLCHHWRVPLSRLENSSARRDVRVRRLLLGTNLGATQAVNGVWSSASLLQSGFKISGVWRRRSPVKLYVAGSWHCRSGRIYRIVAREQRRRWHPRLVATTVTSAAAARRPTVIPVPHATPTVPACPTCRSIFAATNPTKCQRRVADYRNPKARLVPMA